MLPTTGAAIAFPVQRSVAFALSPLFSPMAAQLAVIVFVPLPTFSKSTTTSPPASGPAHTCSGIVESTAGGGAGGGAAELGLLARHQGVLAGKFGIIGSSALAPLLMLVMAELNCPSEFRYHSW